jgi:hypothetical protein
MHPHLIQALARERRAEVLRAQHFRDSGAEAVAPSVSAMGRPWHHVRRALGSALVAAGTRLMAPRPATYVLQASRDRTIR